MEKLMKSFINESLIGTSLYYYKGSIWVMFSDRNEWVIELNQHRMLFFNYEFFVELFKYVSMDPVVSKKYIVKWVESMIKNKIKDSYEINDCNDLGKVVLLAEEINLEGIRGVLEINNFFKRGFDDAIQDGVKLT
jgi:hypothetical protein